MSQHTILLVQAGAVGSRTFSDYETVSAAMDGVCAMFEKRLKSLNPSMRQITYDINDLFTFIDSLPDLSALVYAQGACQAKQPYMHANSGLTARRRAKRRRQARLARVGPCLAPSSGGGVYRREDDQYRSNARVLTTRPHRQVSMPTRRTTRSG